MSETLQRMVRMLSLIPRAPRKITVKELVDHLRESGFQINNRRMIERDLVNLSQSQHFPITCDGHKPAGWSWVAGARVIDIPCMDAHTALTFMLARRFLEPMLPRSTLRFLDPHFASARDILDSRKSRKLSEWPQKVHVLPKGQPMITPEIPEPVIEAVYTALLEERRFVARYRKRGATEAKQYKVDPLGLVYRSDQVYLICCVSDHEQPIQLVLHRMLAAELLDEPRRVPDGFELEAYVRGSGFQYGAGEAPVRLRVRFDRQAALQLHETPLSADQVLREPDADHIELEATVVGDWQLRWWLLSFGDKAEVLAPAELREEFAAAAARMARMYAD